MVVFLVELAHDRRDRDDTFDGTAHTRLLDTTEATSYTTFDLIQQSQIISTTPQSLSLPQDELSLMLNFEANHDSGVYSDYADEAARLAAYQTALLNIKNFTTFRGRLYQRDRAT